MARIGLRHTKLVLAELEAVLRRVWRKPPSVKSDYAREHAETVGMAASLQMITTQMRPAQFARAWHITIKGQAWLAEQES